ASVNHRRVSCGFQRTHSTLRCLPGEMGLHADHHHRGVRHLRPGRTGSAADSRFPFELRRTTPGAAVRDRHPGSRPGRFISCKRTARARYRAAPAGLATGAAAGAVGAGMLDLDRARGTLANAIAPVTGTATGALLSGLLAQYLPAPTRLVYLVLLA